MIPNMSMQYNWNWLFENLQIVMPNTSQLDFLLSLFIRRTDWSHHLHLGIDWSQYISEVTDGIYDIARGIPPLLPFTWLPKEDMSGVIDKVPQPLDKDDAITLICILFPLAIHMLSDCSYYYVLSHTPQTGQVDQAVLFWKLIKMNDLKKDLQAYTIRIYTPKGDYIEKPYTSFLNNSFLTSVDGFKLSSREFMQQYYNQTHTRVKVDYDIIQPFLDFVRIYICSGNELHYNIEMQKNVWMFRNLFEHLSWCTVLFGEEGSGKSTYIQILQDLWTKTFTTSDTIDGINGKTAGELLRNKKLVVVHEIPAYSNRNRKDRSLWSKMKTRITEDAIVIKNPREEIPNYCNYILCTNEVGALPKPPAGKKSRRYFKLSVTTPEDDYFVNFFTAIGKHRGRKKRQRFYTHLFSYFRFEADITDFDPHKFLTMLERSA
jgi:hypothetical protein